MIARKMLEYLSRCAILNQAIFFSALSDCDSFEYARLRKRLTFESFGFD